nr:hypothetical protein [Bacillus thuringiensis]
MDNYWGALRLLSEALEEQNNSKLEQAMKLFKKATESIKSKTN